MLLVSVTHPPPGGATRRRAGAGVARQRWRPQRAGQRAGPAGSGRCRTRARRCGRDVAVIGNRQRGITLAGPRRRHVAVGRIGPAGRRHDVGDGWRRPRSIGGAERHHPAEAQEHADLRRGWRGGRERRQQRGRRQQPVPVRHQATPSAAMSSHPCRSWAANGRTAAGRQAARQGCRRQFPVRGQAAPTGLRRSTGPAPAR